MSDKALGLEAPQETRSKSVRGSTSDLRVQRTQGDNGSAGEQVAALTSWWGEGSVQGWTCCSQTPGQHFPLQLQ